MDCSFPRVCEACGQENGVGFKDGQWRCDACLESVASSDDPGKPLSSRRIFLKQATPLVVQALIKSANHHSPPLGERAAQAVIGDYKTRFQKKPEKRSRAGQAKPITEIISSGKGSGRKKQASRSQRFTNRRKS